MAVGAVAGFKSMGVTRPAVHIATRERFVMSVKITDEMIRAGLGALARGAGAFDEETLIVAVYSAMAGAEPLASESVNPSEQPDDHASKDGR